MIEAIGISEDEYKKPMDMNEQSSNTNLLNPYSKVVCLILYLYSMEIGSPALYAEANRVAREVDKSYLKELGPFLRCLNVISLRAEYFKKDNDIIQTGKMINSYPWFKNNLLGLFLLFRGLSMPEKYIEPFKI